MTVDIKLGVCRQAKAGSMKVWRVLMNQCHFAYSHFACLLPLGAILPTHAKCDQNNVKQLKQAVQVYKVKGIVPKKK